MAKPVYANLAFELNVDAGVPAEAHALPVGPFRATDGRPCDVPAWLLDASIAAKLIAKAQSQQNDILIDFEHQSLRTADNGKPVLAAGWIPRSFEWRDASGLWATGIKWVGDTAELLRKKQYRYISTVFAYDGESGEVLEIISLCLTNTPALDGLAPLADLNRNPTSPKENSMDDKTRIAELTVERNQQKEQIAALTTERDAEKQKVADLTVKNGQLETEVAALRKEKADAAAAVEAEKHAGLVKAALADGRLLPAQKAWADKQPLAALSEFLGVALPSALAGGRQADLTKGDGTASLTAEEKSMCGKMGVSEAEYAALKCKKTV